MQHALRFEFEARYHSLGQPAPKAWLVCHGYGQLAHYFIRHFQPLADLGHYVVAPEGLSRFYLQGHSGRVGASWMTREERLTDIKNYLTYLDAVAQCSGLTQATDINLLGFSQGVATACRWFMHSGLRFNRLVLWAGVFPPDQDPDLSSDRLHEIKLYQVWGTEDPFLQADLLQKQTHYLQSLHPESFHSMSFAGVHQLHTPTLLNIAQS